jgi:hypothetical protein
MREIRTGPGSASQRVWFNVTSALVSPEPIFNVRARLFNGLQVLGHVIGHRLRNAGW